jgi:hypothetical protein
VKESGPESTGLSAPTRRYRDVVPRPLFSGPMDSDIGEDDDDEISKAIKHVRSISSTLKTWRETIIAEESDWWEWIRQGGWVWNSDLLDRHHDPIILEQPQDNSKNLTWNLIIKIKQDDNWTSPLFSSTPRKLHRCLSVRKLGGLYIYRLMSVTWAFVIRRYWLFHQFFFSFLFYTQPSQVSRREMANVQASLKNKIIFFVK